MARSYESQTILRTVVDRVMPASSTSTDSVSVTPVPATLIDKTFSSSTNLTTSVLGAQVLSVSDEWFAPATNLLTPTPAVWKEGLYVHAGKWMDGWESKRHNQSEFDYVVMKLGCVGTVDAVEVDTAFFNGNEAPAAGLDACFLTSEQEQNSGVEKPDFSAWTEILPPQPCGPSQRQAWRVAGPAVSGKQVTHLRLKMYPDGGIARLRVYGKVAPPPLPVAVATSERPVEDLVSALNGGVAIECSDQHFGVKSNLLLPGRGQDMRDGWETSRSRSKGHVDWVIIKLGLRGREIEKIVVDTKDFRGNFPRAVRIDGYSVSPAKAALGREDEPGENDARWRPLLQGDMPCQSDLEHVFEGTQLAVSGPLEDEVWTHVKMTIIPDGGVKRIRVYGRRA